jgi:hypothetical protein
LQVASCFHAYLISSANSLLSSSFILSFLLFSFYFLLPRFLFLSRPNTYTEQREGTQRDEGTGGGESDRERERERERKRLRLRERSSKERDMQRERDSERSREREIDGRERGPDLWWVCAEKAGGVIFGGTQADFWPTVEDS